MNGLLVIIILAVVLYFIYQKFKIKIYDEDKYTIGLIKNDENIKKYGILMQKLFDINLQIKLFDDYDKLMNSVNNGDIDFGITYENYFIDSKLGLNSYEDKIYKNIEFCTALYFNYFQLLSNIYIKNEQFQEKFTNISDLKNFKKIYKRNYVIGTESFDTISFLNMFIMLVSFGFNPINFKKFDENKDYDDDVIFYLIDTEENLAKEMIESKIDGLFLFRTFNDSTINYIDNEKDIIFLDIDFKESYFDQLFSIYFYKNPNILINVKTLDDLNEKIGFETRMSRVVLIANNKVKDDIVNDLVYNIYGHNNYLTNSITNSSDLLDKKHNYFEPIQLAYIDKNIPIHNGAKDYFKKIGFVIDKEYIIDKLKLRENLKLKSYWKYKKIGLSKFNIE